MTLKINKVPDSLKYQFGQNSLKDVDSKVFKKVLQKDGRKDGSITISLRNFVGEGIIMSIAHSCTSNSI